MQTAFRSEERFTQTDFWEWLQDLPASDVNRYELIGGRIVMSPPAGYPHSDIVARIVTMLVQHVRARGVGRVLESSAGYVLPAGETLSPDVSFISAARIAAAPSPERGRFERIVPDLVIAVLSDSTARRDRVEKKDIYARNGVDEYWIVDPDRCEVTVCARQESGFSAADVFRTGRVRSRVLPDLELEVEDLFADLA